MLVVNFMGLNKKKSLHEESNSVLTQIQIKFVKPFRKGDFENKMTSNKVKCHLEAWVLFSKFFNNFIKQNKICGKCIQLT